MDQKATAIRAEQRLLAHEETQREIDARVAAQLHLRGYPPGPLHSAGPLPPGVAPPLMSHMGMPLPLPHPLDPRLSLPGDPMTGPLGPLPLDPAAGV